MSQPALNNTNLKKQSRNTRSTRIVQKNAPDPNRSISVVTISAVTSVVKTQFAMLKSCPNHCPVAT